MDVSHQAEAPAAPPPQPAVDRLSDTLGGLLERNGEALAGRVHLVGLDLIKQKLGPKWDSYKKHVYTMAENIVSRHVKMTDTFERYGDDQYLLIFADLSPQDSQLKLFKIAKEIYKHFLGDADLEELKVQTSLSHVDGSVNMEEINLQDILAGLAGCATSDMDLSQVKSSKNYEMQAVRGAGGAIDFEPIEAKPPATADPESVAPAAKDAGDRRARLANRFANFKATSMDYMFEPVWDLKQQVISTYKVLPVSTLENGTIVKGYDILRPEYGGGETNNLDLDQLENGLDVFAECFANNFRFFCVMPVHFDTLSSLSTRTEYCSICEVIPPPLRQHIIFEIVGTPSGVPFGRLSEITQPLKQYSHFLFLRADENFKSFTNYHEVGIQAVSIGYHFAQESLTQRIAVIKKFILQAKLAHLNTYVMNADDLQTVVAADKCGINLLSGGTIEELTPFPEASHRFTRKDYMAQVSQ